jgi:DNA-binding transcriptional LysR family regulator
MLEPLRHFALIVEHGTYREAARRAHLSQPAITQSIKRLESELGTSLLERGRTGASPTAAGAALLPHARAALEEVERGKRAALEAAGIEASEVRLVAGAAISTYLLPALVARFRKAHPSASLHLRELPSDEAIAAFERREVDLAIVGGKVGRAWLADELVLVGAPSLDPDDAKLLVLPRGAASRELVDRYFPERAIAMELGSIAALLAHARAGAGLALVSRFALDGELGERRLKIVPDRRTPLRRRLRILHRDPKTMPAAARALLAILREEEAQRR